MFLVLSGFFRTIAKKDAYQSMHILPRYEVNMNQWFVCDAYIWIKMKLFCQGWPLIGLVELSSQGR